MVWSLGMGGISQQRSWERPKYELHFNTRQFIVLCDTNVEEKTLLATSVQSLLSRNATGIVLSVLQMRSK